MSGNVRTGSIGVDIDHIPVMCDTDWFEMDIEVGIAKNADISISYRYCLEIYNSIFFKEQVTIVDIWEGALLLNNSIGSSIKLV